MPLRHVYIRSRQYVLVALQYERASSYSNSLKCNYCNFTLWMPPCLGCRESHLRTTGWYKLLCTELLLLKISNAQVDYR